MAAKTHEEMIDDLVNQVDDWDINSLTLYAKRTLMETYKLQSEDSIRNEWESCGFGEWAY